ncbi:WW domain-containing oxidoreductase isoform X1 [Microplitis mediator]|uniref:WW domain-containing oxidoreductase isoform X1 n=2 Tax=Microplitis mediator TaxID=375433 RepID=UPI00255546F3|nr:WW domain-containing oxidoreductase isoform X1 [Microplitis mediator]
MTSVSNDSDSEDELPPGWEERATFDGKVYYINHFKKSTQWTHPRTSSKKIVAGELPSGWERCTSNDGKMIFIDHLNHTTTYTDPRLAFAVEYRDPSQSVRQRFDASSSALAVLHGRDLKGKVALVTGSNTGIGFETAKSLAFHGCTVVMACRSTKKAAEAIQRIKSEQEYASCEALSLDLSSLRSVKNAVKEFKKKYRLLNILVLNAGVFALPYSLTEDGYETTFQVNYLSQYYLTLLLEHHLKNTSDSRIVVVASESHRFSSIQVIEDIHQSILSPPVFKYWSVDAYSNSKLCNILFAQELAKRWPSVSVFSCHPGNMVSSYLSRYSWFYKFLFTIVRPFTKSLQQAASTIVFCATAPELEGLSGIYFNNCFRCETSNISMDQSLASRLWYVSQDMIMNIVQRKNFCTF